MITLTRMAIVRLVFRLAAISAYIFVGTGPTKLHKAFNEKTGGTLFQEEELHRYYRQAQDFTSAAAALGLLAWISFRLTNWELFRGLYVALNPECALVVSAFGFLLRLLDI
jgi:hypothetical protein